MNPQKKSIARLDLPQILIVDDYPELLDTLDILLSCFGYQPISTSCSQSGLEIIDTIAPSLVILDIDMPKIDGLEFIKRVRQKHSSQSIPILLFTGLDRWRSASYLQSGANVFLQKSATPQELLTKVNDLVVTVPVDRN